MISIPFLKKILSAFFVIITLAAFNFHQKPVLYIIGDSTVQNSDGNGVNEKWGWGSLLKSYLDTNKITLSNHAQPGASTRTFISDGRWNKILETLKPGDFVMMQFGHNDQSPVNDSSRARGTLKGIGEEVQDIQNLKTNQPETVHTYGWYMRKFIRETKQKGAIPVVCSLVPRDKWTKENKVDRQLDYVNWAQQVAKEEGAYFIDLNQLIANKWEQLGPETVKAFFPGDHTHTNLKGAELNVSAVVEGLRSLKNCPLNKFLR
jgi:rhamnogalacturonan acetylesterase